MTRLADELSNALTRLANDRRQAVAQYANVASRPGRSRIPNRLLSDIGFLSDTQFTYVTAAPSNLTPHDDARTPTLIALRPYGLREDVDRFLSTEDSDRVEHGDATLGGVGITHYPGADDYVMSADLDSGTVGLQKTLNVVRQVIDSRGGPAYHVILNRRGDVIVAAGLDCETTASGDHAPLSIDVALETAVAMSREDHFRRDFTRLIEIPFTSVQLTSLAILVAKLRTAYPSIPVAMVQDGAGVGLSYLWLDAEKHRYQAYGLQSMNFTSGEWRNRQPVFDYSLTDPVAFFGRVTTQGSFDLASEIFRSDQQAPPQSARTAARTAIGTADTAGAQSVYLAAYATIAALDRNTDLQSQSRRQVFIQRANRAHDDADDAAEKAGQVAEGAEVTSDDAAAPVTATGPHVYDFATGFWQDSPTPRSY